MIRILPRVRFVLRWRYPGGHFAAFRELAAGEDLESDNWRLTWAS